MGMYLLWVSLAALLAAVVRTDPATAREDHGDSGPVEVSIPIGGATLHARVIGQGPPAIVLHGGPDFDQSYLLPELDLLKDSIRMIYYDQRGRGRSAESVRSEEVSLSSEVGDLDRVRQHFRLDTSALLGHSWGALLALEYAVRQPSRVSHLILMNPAPASVKDLDVFRLAYRAKQGDDIDRQREILASSAYQEADPDAVIARYRIHFKRAVKSSDHYEALMGRMAAAFRSQGKEGISKARAVEEQLMRDTWQLRGYDLRPRLSDLRIPTLIIAGDHDFIPFEVAEQIALAIPDATLVTLSDCGHFAYLESPGEVRAAVNDFLQANSAARLSGG